MELIDKKITNNIQEGKKSTKTTLARISVSAREAAEILGISKSTVYNLMDEGVLPWVKIKSRRVILVTDIHELLAKGKVHKKQQEQQKHQKQLERQKCQ